MHPILVDWGPVVIPAWHAFYVLGAIGTFLLLLQLGRLHDSQIPRHELARLYVVAYVAGYFGARLLSIFVEEPEVQGVSAVLASLFRFGPMTFYGGAIFAFVFGTLYVKIRGLPLANVIDLAIPSGLLGLAIGRVGCFLNGDDFGKAAPLVDGVAPIWAVTFPNLKDGVARYPVQLMETALALAVVVLLCRTFVRLRLAFRPGFIGFLGIVAYAVFRFGLEFIRDDFRGEAFGTGLSTSQFISLVVLLLCGLTIPSWVAAVRSKA